MTSYTMNGHRHSKAQIEPQILLGMVGNQAARIARAQWRLRATPEKFSCLDSSEPHIQLQTALKQIETLLQRNTQLLETVLLLGQALGDAHLLIHKDASIAASSRENLRLSQDFHDCMEW